MSGAAAAGGRSGPIWEFDAVFSAATTLADTLERTPEERDYGARQLLRAVDELDASAGSRSGFAAAAGSEAVGTATIDQALLKAAADAQLASVLLAASEAVGEPGTPTGGASLRAAVADAQANLASLITDPTGPAPTPLSADVSAAFQAFKGHAEATLASILDDSDNVVTAAWTALGSQKDRLVEAFRQLGGLVSGLAPVGGLLRRALDKLLSAVRTVSDIAARVPIDTMAAQLQRLRDAVSSRNALAYAFASDAVRQDLAALTIPASVTTEALQRASAEIIALGEEFATLSRRARLVTGAIGLTGGLLTMYSPGSMAMLAVPAAHAAVIAAIVVIGMDYTDAGTMLNLVRGVREIARGLAG